MNNFDDEQKLEEPKKLDLSVLEKQAVCKTHGEYTSKGMMGGKIWMPCPDCAKIQASEKQVIEERLAANAERERWERKLGQACIPERYKDRRFENYIATNEGSRNALQTAHDFAVNFKDANGRSLIFCGLPGTGKTHLANATCLYVMEQHKASALFTTVQKAIRRIKDTWDKGAEETETQAIEALVWPDLLVLDEIGIQFGSETEKMLLFDVLNERYEQRKSVILISNLTVKEVVVYLGERIFDRLKEDGGQSVVFNWKSHRGS